jgi:hypothetical protein
MHFSVFLLFKQTSAFFLSKKLLNFLNKFWAKWRLASKSAIRQISSPHGGRRTNPVASTFGGQPPLYF